MLRLFKVCTIVVFYFCIISFLTIYIQLLNIFNLLYNNAAPKTKYEYIIVGAGTAGTTIMAGLPSKDVLILEAGGLTTSSLDIPILTPILQKSPFDWSYKTTTQSDACLALMEQRSLWPMGKGYGGSQILNYMIWTRGHPEDYRGWFKSSNEYNYDTDILPYFRELETNLKLTNSTYRTKLAKAFVDASKEFGYENGFFYPKLTQYNGKRRTIAHHSYENCRPEHDLVLNAKVVRLLYDSTSPYRVIGVLYQSYGYTFEAYAVKGVILSAGTIGTPNILLASGIGCNCNRRNSTVPFRKFLPVGRNLQDHVTTGIDLIILNKTLNMFPWDVIRFETLFQYFYRGDGPLTMGGCEALGFVNVNNSVTPNIGFMVIPMGVTMDGGIHFKSILNINHQTWTEYFQPLIGQTTISILPIVLHPKSRGYISFNDDHISINPNYLSHPDDVDLLVTGIRIIEQLLEMPSMKRLGAEINPKPLTGCEHHPFRSKEYWTCYVRHITLTAYHPVGTCRMGSADDPSTVVSRDFRVLGIENLYVCDASVMPNLPSGNPNAAVAMLAKKFLSLLVQRK